MALQGFNETYYLGVKLDALQAGSTTAADWAGKDAAFLTTTLAAMGYTPEQHYQTFLQRQNLVGL